MMIGMSDNKALPVNSKTKIIHLCTPLDEYSVLCTYSNSRFRTLRAGVKLTVRRHENIRRHLFIFDENKFKIHLSTS